MFLLPLLLQLHNQQGLASGKELKRCGQNISKFPIYRITEKILGIILKYILVWMRKVSIFLMWNTALQ
jgi:hypothetical protein